VTGIVEQQTSVETGARLFQNFNIGVLPKANYKKRRDAPKALYLGKRIKDLYENFIGWLTARNTTVGLNRLSAALLRPGATAAGLRTAAAEAEAGAD
jgi:hypothetical protein